MTEMESLLEPIHSFLHCKTPQAWINEAAKPENLNDLLIDHCNCELKAAQTAVLLIRKYGVTESSATSLLSWIRPYEDFVYQRTEQLSAPAEKNTLIGNLHLSDDTEEKQNLLGKMIRLIKEELHHFEQVLEIMNKRGIPYRNLNASRYAKGLIKHVRTHEPARLIDKLIVGAFIEARSCERFASLAAYLDEELAKFYVSLLRSEARHYQDYIRLAQSFSAEDITPRIEHFAAVEARLISDPDKEFRLLSGPL